LTQTYETMVLLDNDVVRQDWKKAKAIVTDTVAKYGGSLESCRRWDERRLAYPMKRKNRATFYLAYHDMPGDMIPGFLRDLELNESVLRYLMVRVDETPEDERTRAARRRPDRGPGRGGDGSPHGHRHPGGHSRRGFRHGP
jgi:small subunit ribosomal protein S6